MLQMEAESVATRPSPPQSTELVPESTEVKLGYKEACQDVEKALNSDEHGDLPRAMELYTRANQRLRALINKIKNDQNMKRKVITLIEKITHRLQELRPLLESPLISLTHTNYTDKPPSYEETMSDDTKSTHSNSNSPTNGTIIVTVDNVRIYHVKPSGAIESHAEDTLYLCEFNEKSKNQPPVFLGCGSWVTPIIPMKTTVYCPTSFLYLFPDSHTHDLEANSSESFTGVVINETVSKKQKNQFDFAINSLCTVKQGTLHTPHRAADKQCYSDDSSDNAPPKGWGEWISDKMYSGANYLSGYITTGEEKGDKLLESGGDKLRSKIEPNPKATEIHSALETGFVVGKKVTGAVVTVGDYAFSSLSKLTLTAGEKVGSLVSNTETVKNCQNNHHINQALVLTKTTAKSGGKVFVSASDAAKTLLSRLSNETVSTVDHKYGNSAANITEKSIGIGANAIEIASYFNWKSLALKYAVTTTSEANQRYGEKNQDQKVQ